MANLSREEMETVIRCSVADQEWDIVTADPRMIRYLEKRGYQKIVDEQFKAPYFSFKVPFRRLRFLAKEKRIGRPPNIARLARNGSADTLTAEPNSEKP
jgi:hypothetical protein